MTCGVVLFVIGLVLAAGTCLQDRPWQFGFVLGVALLVAGAMIVVDRLDTTDVAVGERSGPPASGGER